VTVGANGSDKLMKKRAKRHMDEVSIHDLRRRITQLRNADLRILSQEAVADRVARVIHQYPFQIRPWVVTGVYRARVNKPGALFTSASELWYPPRPDRVTSPSRLNKRGQVLFYAASMPNAAALELRVKPGDMVTVLVARTRNGTFEELSTAFIGLERALAPEAQALGPNEIFRTAQHFRQQLGEGNYKKWLLIDDYLSEIFGAVVPDGEEQLYRPTIAMADLLFKAPGVDAITYPSVATQDKGLNICMQPARADTVFKPSEAWMLEVGETGLHSETKEPLMRVHFRLRSYEIGTDGVIHWRPTGDGLDQESIMSFVRRRMEQLERWPTMPSGDVP
jgi:RES domain